MLGKRKAEHPTSETEPAQKKRKINKEEEEILETKAYFIACMMVGKKLIQEGEFKNGLAYQKTMRMFNHFLSAMNTTNDETERFDKFKVDVRIYIKMVENQSEMFDKKCRLMKQDIWSKEIKDYSKEITQYSDKSDILRNHLTDEIIHFKLKVID